jgi:hypothetical protein
MNVEFINCTPHEIVVVDKDRQPTTYPKSGKDVRLVGDPQKELPFQTLGVKVATHQTFKDVSWSEPVPKGSWILVSMPVGEFFAAHKDKCDYWVFGPDTGPENAVRDQTGRIVGTKRLVFYAAPSGTETTCYICAAHWPAGGYCPSCGADCNDAMLHIEGTHLFVRDKKLVRTPTNVELPQEWKEGDDIVPSHKKARKSPDPE